MKPLLHLWWDLCPSPNIRVLYELRLNRTKLPVEDQRIVLISHFFQMSLKERLYVTNKFGVAILAEMFGESGSFSVSIPPMPDKVYFL